MNGGENGFAGALFFSLAAVGVVLKVDDIIGWVIGMVCAFAAAFCLRQALNQAAVAAEEDHQRIEIQFQQLRQKLGESSSAARNSMQSVMEISETVQESLQRINSHISELRNLTNIAETSAAIGAVVQEMESNRAETTATLKNIENFLSKNLPAEIKTLSDEIKKVSATTSNNVALMQSSVKFSQVTAQLIKNPDFSKDLKKISASLDKLNAKIENQDAMKNLLEDAKIRLEAIIKVGEKISAQNQSSVKSAETVTAKMLDAAESFNKISNQFSTSAANNSATFNDVRRDLATLITKLDACNGLMKATLEQYSNLTTQDIRILEKISERVNGK